MGPGLRGRRAAARAGGGQGSPGRAVGSDSRRDPEPLVPVGPSPGADGKASPTRHPAYLPHPAGPTCAPDSIPRPRRRPPPCKPGAPTQARAGVRERTCARFSPDDPVATQAQKALGGAASPEGLHLAGSSFTQMWVLTCGSRGPADSPQRAATALTVCPSSRHSPTTQRTGSRRPNQSPRQRRPRHSVSCPEGSVLERAAH